MTSRIIRLPEVIEITGLSRSSIYSYISQGNFPASVQIGSRAVGWLETEVNEWVLHQIQKSRGV